MRRLHGMKLREGEMDRLLKELAKRRIPGRVFIAKGTTRLELGPS